MQACWKGIDLKGSSSWFLGWTKIIELAIMDEVAKKGISLHILYSGVCVCVGWWKLIQSNCFIDGQE